MPRKRIRTKGDGKSFVIFAPVSDASNYLTAAANDESPLVHTRGLIIHRMTLHVLHFDGIISHYLYLGDFRYGCAFVNGIISRRTAFFSYG